MIVKRDYQFIGNLFSLLAYNRYRKGILNEEKKK